jgi:hypothetical protein
MNEFQIMLRVENTGDGVLDSFVLFGIRGSDYLRKNSGRKQI